MTGNGFFVQNIQPVSVSTHSCTCHVQNCGAAFCFSSSMSQLHFLCYICNVLSVLVVYYWHPARQCHVFPFFISQVSTVQQKTVFFTVMYWNYNYCVVVRWMLKLQINTASLLWCKPHRKVTLSKWSKFVAYIRPISYILHLQILFYFVLVAYCYSCVPNYWYLWYSYKWYNNSGS